MNLGSRDKRTTLCHTRRGNVSINNLEKLRSLISRNEVCRHPFSSFFNEARKSLESSIDAIPYH